MMVGTTDDNTNPFSGFFWGNDPNVNQQLRQRIALQMMASGKKAYPKNLGEGLSAIGDSLGEIGMMRQMLQADAAQTATPVSVRCRSRRRHFQAHRSAPT